MLPSFQSFVFQSQEEFYCLSTPESVRDHSSKLLSMDRVQKLFGKRIKLIIAAVIILLCVPNLHILIRRNTNSPLIMA